MNNPFRSSSRTRPCPCCGDTKHRCKQVEIELKLPDWKMMTETMVLCHRQRGDLPEYAYWGDSYNARWGKYIDRSTAEILDSAWDRRLTGELPAINCELPKPKKRSISYAHLLSPQLRHQEISKLLSQLQLAPRHYTSLAERNLDRATIAHYHFKTVEYRQKLSPSISESLAGVAPGGNSLANNYSGILIPIRDEAQLFSGWQTRLDYDLNCKYLWPTRDEFTVHHHSTGEIPLNYVLPIKKVESQVIALVEGVGFKAIHVANRYGQITVGASGAMFASSPRQFARLLKSAAVITASNRCLLYPDAGAVRNYLVMIQYHKLARLVKSWGFELRVAWWGQFTKGQPDIDEYSGRFELITWQQFCQFARRLVVEKTAYNNWLNSSY
ncbi:MAG: hypothetical protein WBM44_19390 [Waterburya sp.]